MEKAVEFVSQHPTCAVCKCNPTQHIHHMAGKIGKNLFLHWLPVCFICHAWIHGNVKEATEKGYLIVGD